MPGRPFRFVHASDLHLEMPLQGVAEVPDHLRDLFIAAPYTAARRAFDAALAEEAEFLVLAGDVLRPQRTGPYGPRFLVEQCGRLAERGIAVYWAGGEVDPPESWPAAFPLPPNVHVFGRGRPSEHIHQRDGVPLARLVGASRDAGRPIRPGEYEADPAGLFSIGVVHGEVEAAALQARNIHYWALGGRHERTTLFTSPTVAHDPGSPQGRRPQDAGAHGCTLVQVDEAGHARTSLLPTDAARWLSERAAIDQATTREGLETLLRDRLRAIVEMTPQMDLLVSWTIAGSGPLVGQLRHGNLADTLLGVLRSEFGFGTPAAWSVGLEVEPAAPLPHEWYEQETIRGDFLRAVRQLELTAAAPLEIETYLSEAHQAGTLAAAAAPADQAARQRVLQEAALLGADLLSGEEAQP